MFLLSAHTDKQLECQARCWNVYRWNESRTLLLLQSSPPSLTAEMPAAAAPPIAAAARMPSRMGIVKKQRGGVGCLAGDGEEWRDGKGRGFL